MRVWLAAFVLSGCCIDCSGAGDALYGPRVTSPDGGTHLIVGPFSWKCAARIDKKPAPQGVPIAVKPGKHFVGCDEDEMEVDVPAGMTVTVDYFGP
ncbi:MAG: hypothetical protein ACO1OB_16245 [Archangium sp.]